MFQIHGLRHENLNPLIGLMVDTIRPALVWEYCSRGSLEDVLIQDEIKLDWSFRLSLLTDLVRVITLYIPRRFKSLFKIGNVPACIEIMFLISGNEIFTLLPLPCSWIIVV